MNRYDIEFWNGAWECVITAEEKIKNCQNIEQAREEIEKLKKGIETIKIVSFERALGNALI